MPKIIVLPHEELCPDGNVIEVEKGTSVCNALLKNNIDIEHACDQVCACTTCHVFLGSCVLHTHREHREHREHWEHWEHREHGHVPRWVRTSEGDAGARVYR